MRFLKVINTSREEKLLQLITAKANKTSMEKLE